MVDVPSEEDFLDMVAVNKISMGINYRKKTNSRMTGSGNYFAEVDRRVSASG